MVARRTSTPATYADIEALAPTMVGEIVRGVLYANPRPAIPHARASTRLGGALDGPFDRGRGGPGGWVILFEADLHLGADVLVPDHAGWLATHHDDTRVRAEPFEAVELDLSELWAR